jgi:hypothetical protein
MFLSDMVGQHQTPDVVLALGRGLGMVTETENVAKPGSDSESEWKAARRWSRELSLQSNRLGFVRTPTSRGMEGWTYMAMKEQE